MVILESEFHSEMKIISFSISLNIKQKLALLYAAYNLCLPQNNIFMKQNN